MKRVLAAILPSESLKIKGDLTTKSWFFVLTGTDVEIESVAAPLDQFLKSIRFEAPNYPQWTLPAGWTARPEKDQQLPVIDIPTGADGKVLTLTIASRKFGRVDDNVNMWRMNMALAELGSMDLEGFYRPELIGGRPAVLVDMVGPKSRGRLKPLEDTLPPLKFQTPADWQEIAPTTKFYVLSFLAETMDKKAEINVSVFPRDGGGLVQNVNRWRTQLKLDSFTAQQVNDLPDIAIGTAMGKIVDFAEKPRPHQDARDANRTMGALLIRPDESVFVKMTGPSELVGQQKASFEAFLKSVQFVGKEELK